MGKVVYATGIDHVSGSLAKPKVKDGSLLWFLPHRYAPCGSDHEPQLYSSLHPSRRCVQSYHSGNHRGDSYPQPFLVYRSFRGCSFERPHEDLCRPSSFRSSEGSAGRQKDHALLPLEAGERGVRCRAQRLKAETL